MSGRLNHYIKGYLKIQITGYGPERFLNLCGTKGIELWEINDTGGIIYSCISLKNFWEIRPMARKARVKIRVVSRYGFPFFLHRNRKRKLFAAGLLCFFISLYILSLFIWDIHFEGNSQYSYEVLLKYCMTQDVHYGMKKSQVDCQALEEGLRSAFPEITWVSAQVSGTRLMIKIKENQAISRIPEKEETPGDLVASRDGVITSMIVRRGMPLVSVGDEVKQGQILVSGALPVTDDGGQVIKTNYVHSDGDIIASTSYEFSRNLPLFAQTEVKTGRIRKGMYVQAGSHSFFFLLPRPEGTSWNVLTEEKQLHLFENFYLPVYWGNIRAEEFISYEHPYTDEEKKEAAEKFSSEIWKNLRGKGVQILKNHVKILDNESLCQITVEIQAEESIGSFQAVQVPTEELKETNNLNERN
ncbi:MAG TPA: sporulation protein YqfD [Candidatus Hungatella pullicola]|nr:sporulation protein YqfD [Candidatus Hungatella pullicola]